MPRLNTDSVELVLGGGGVKGFAHVGFLKAVDKLNINYSTITGVSIGSIIAVLYVNGYSTAEIEKIFAEELQRVSPKKLARSMLLPPKLDRAISGEEPVSLLGLMKDLVERYKLKPRANLRLIAFNAVSREPVVFSGLDYDLATAMAASCSIPFVFYPIEDGKEVPLGQWLADWLANKLRRRGGTPAKERELLFDGGLYHPAPIDFCREKAIVAKLGFANKAAPENLPLADRIFHALEQRSSRYLDACFPDSTDDGSPHIYVNVGRGDVAALSFGISHKQQKALTRTAYRRSLTKLGRAVEAGLIPTRC